MASIVASQHTFSPKPNDGASSKVERQHPSNNVIFVGKGNTTPSKYIIIPKSLENDVGTFTEECLIKGLDEATEVDKTEAFLPTKPGVLISVTGGAQDFYMHASKLEQVFNRGLLRAAQNVSAWIVDGGLDAGVMQYVGKSIKEVAVEDVPCIGIASHKMVVMHEMLTEKGFDAAPAEYVANQPNTPTKCALNPNHTHFILVDSPVAQWGQEIVFRSYFEKYISDKYNIPLVLIVVNGGPGTLDTVAQGAEKDFAIVVVQGSGRASDAVAALVRKAHLANVDYQHSTSSLMAIHDDNVDVSPWVNLLKEARGDEKKIAQWTKFMDTIVKNHKCITIFNADDEASADMDIFILRAILSNPAQKMGLKDKLRLGVVWNRDDIIQEILETEKDSGLSSFEKRDALNSAFELAIQLDRPLIFKMLAENGAQKDSVNLKKLYYYKPVKSYFRRLPAYARTRRVSNIASGIDKLIPTADELSTTEYSSDSNRNKAFLREMFRDAGALYQGYYLAFAKKFECSVDSEELGTGTIQKRKKKISYREQGVHVSFTDILIWAIFVNRLEMAKIIWQHTTLPVHSALLACSLYRYLSNHCSDKEGYLENADWFEDEAIKMMDKMAYIDIKDVLVWEWSEMGNMSALDIAKDADCKRFIGHTHVQSLLDDAFYSDPYGKLEPTIPTWQMWACILVPPFISLIYKPNEAQPNQHFYNYYLLPIIKFWTNTFLYIFFLFFQAYVLCILDYGNGFHITEYILWVWVFSLTVDELSQYIKDPKNHFQYLSNYMDSLLIALHLAYMVLRWISYITNDEHTYSAAVNTLICACIISWGRLLNAFAISDTLGPLYFVIIRLFKDIVIWFFVFVIFAISFQLGFISITKQVGLDPSTPYPDGTFPVAFFTIIGEYSYAADMLKAAPLGVALLAIYAMLAQILLVNLLIAMMGDTYSNVSENSASEWKFYRLELMMENQSASFHPPPTNLIIVPIQILSGYRSLTAKKIMRLEANNNLDDANSLIKESEPRTTFDLHRVLKKMRIARDDVIDEEVEEVQSSVQTIVTSVDERLRTLHNERENDRTFLNKKFKDLETTLTAASHQAAASGGGGAVAGLALDKLYDTIRNLQETNQLLVQQNQNILAVLQQQQTQQQQMQQQLVALSTPATSGAPASPSLLSPGAAVRSGRVDSVSVPARHRGLSAAPPPPPTDPTVEAGEPSNINNNNSLL